MKEYNAAVEPAFRAQVGHVYTCLAQQCLGWVGRWVAYQHANGAAVAPIIYTFESGAEHEDEADEILKLVRHDPIARVDYHYYDHIFEDKRLQPALQAADVLACETFRDFERNLTGVVRHGDYYLERLVDDRDNILAMNREQIRNFIYQNLNMLTKPKNDQ